MVGFLLGLCAFLLFFLNDYNDWKLGRNWLKACFLIGAVLLLVGTVLESIHHSPPVHGLTRGLFCMLSVVFLVLLIKTLFFALPLKESYDQPGEIRRACTEGMYALCRHPGVLWFAGLYFSLWGTVGFPLWKAAVLSGLNVLLVAFEDSCVFPSKLSGYREYQKKTPFLIPNGNSIRACWHNR